MKRTILHSLYILLLLHSSGLLGQRQSPFKAGIIAGVNFSQIDGDYQFGYDKVGYNFGIRGGFALTKRFDIMTELLYVQKGTQPQITTGGGKREATIDYKYAEVPLLLTHHIKLNNRGFYSASLFIGPSYGKLLKSSSTVMKNFRIDTLATLSINQDKLNKSDISLIFGFNVNFLPNLSLSVSHTTSLNKVYTNPDYFTPTTSTLQKEKYQSFRNYYFTCQILYDFISPKYKPKKKSISKKQK